MLNSSHDIVFKYPLYIPGFALSKQIFAKEVGLKVPSILLKGIHCISYLHCWVYINMWSPTIVFCGQQRFRWWSRCQPSQPISSQQLPSSPPCTTRKLQLMPWWRTKPPMSDTRRRVSVVFKRERWREWMGLWRMSWKPCGQSVLHMQCLMLKKKKVFVYTSFNETEYTYLVLLGLLE